MSKWKRVSALILCIGMVLCLLTSSAYIAHEAEHECTGEECEICENIAQMKALLRSFVLLGVILAVFFGVHAVLRGKFTGNSKRAFAAATLVSWKVRLNN